MKIKSCYTRLFLFILSSLLIWININAQSADIILTNGKIFTSDRTELYVQALAIKDNKILAVGSNAAIEKLVSAETQKINLNGKTVIPGINDAHDHLGYRAPVGKYFWNDNFSIDGPEKSSVLDSIARLVKTAEPGQWITGEIGLRVLQDTTMRASLDSIAPDNPVFLELFWGHGNIANSIALKTCGITDTASDLMGGRYTRFHGTKKITGALYDYAQWPIWYSYCISEPENMIKGLRAYSLEQIKHGITTVQNMNAGIRSSSVYIFADAKLPQRLRIIPYPATTLKGRSVEEWKKISPQLSKLVSISGIKYMIDGTPFDQSALMKKPYHDKWYGVLNFPVDTIKQILKEAIDSNSQLMMHIVGDSSMAIVLSLMKEMASPEVWKTKRVRFEHNSTSMATSEEIKTINDLGILMMHTPMYGRDCPLSSLLEKGIIVGISPDGTINPFIDISIITSEQQNPNENLSREQAVIAYTKTNAYAEFAEETKGSLSPGMLADLAVLSQDIFTVPVEQLKATSSILTIVDGKIVYQEPGTIDFFK